MGFVLACRGTGDCSMSFLCRAWYLSVMHMYLINLKSFDLSSGPGLPPLLSPILLYVSQHRSLSAGIGQKKASSHSLVFPSKTRKRTQKSSGQTHLLNI